MNGGMSRERFEELKEAYALDALSEQERREFKTYLADNPSERAEVDELSSIAALLALAPPEQEPPPALRRSLMSQVRSEAESSGAAVSGAGRESRSGWARRLFGARGLATAAAAAALLGLVVWNVALQSEMRDMRDFQMSAYELQGSGEAETVRGEVVRIGEQDAMLVATDLPELPEGKAYEMWTIDEGEPKPSGVFDAGEGPAIKALEQPISGAETFAITVEPEGGSEQPTSNPIVVADLTSSA